jgi:hypothetical protein
MSRGEHIVFLSTEALDPMPLESGMFLSCDFLPVNLYTQRTAAKIKKIKSQAMGKIKDMKEKLLAAEAATSQPQQEQLHPGELVGEEQRLISELRQTIESERLERAKAEERCVGPEAFVEPWGFTRFSRVAFLADRALWPVSSRVSSLSLELEEARRVPGETHPRPDGTGPEEPKTPGAESTGHSAGYAMGVGCLHGVCLLPFKLTGPGRWCPPGSRALEETGELAHLREELRASKAEMERLREQLVNEEKLIRGTEDDLRATHVKDDAAEVCRRPEGKRVSSRVALDGDTGEPAQLMAARCKLCAS